MVILVTWIASTQPIRLFTAVGKGGYADADAKLLDALQLLQVLNQKCFLAL